MNQGPVYVCDATALIDYYNHFPVEFRRLKKEAAKGRFTIPEGVFRELKRKTDRLYNNVNKWHKAYQIVVEFKSDIRLLSELSRIEQLYGEEVSAGDRDYPGLWKSPAGRKAADGQVVTVGKVKGNVVVSDDRAVRLACLQENVQCIGWAEFARRMRGGSTNNQIKMEFNNK